MLIGLTGKSCSGKNYVSLLLKRKGFEVWDLDAEASKIRKQHSEEILKLFGTSDALELRKIVFNDSEKLRLLESVVYPDLIKKILSCKNDLVINGATIFRSGLDRFCNAVIYVDAPYEMRMERALKRDHISQEEFEKRENSQTDVDYRNVSYRCPVFRIENSGNDFTEDLDKVLSALSGF